MKILYIDVNCKNSSTGDITYNLHKFCGANGIESVVCYGRGKRLKEKGAYKFGYNLETLNHAILTRITGYTGCFSYFSTKRLIRFIEKFKPDLIHIHELHAYFLNIKQILMFVKSLNIPVVFTNHCEFLYTGKCGLGKECTKYSENCGHCPHLKDYPKSLWFDQTSKMLKEKREIFADWQHCVFVSPSSWLLIRSSISFLKNKPLRIIHNGIDTNVFNYLNPSANHFGFNSKIKIILTIAANPFTDLKGGFRVLNLAKKCLELNKNYVFVIVGANRDDIITDNLSNVIIKYKVQDKNELVKYYQEADCLFIPSSYENFPTTSLEAQCCGLPVIGFDVVGVKETILQDNGYTVPYDNMDEVIAKLDYLFSQTINRNDIALRTYDEYSINHMSKSYLKIYNDLLKAK